MADFDINSTQDPNAFNINRTTPEFDFGAQREEGKQFVQDFTDFLSSQETMPAASDRISKSLGLPDLREQNLRFGEISDDLTSQLFGLPQQIAGTTRNSLVTESQRQGLVQAAAQPLQQTLGQVSTAAGKVGARLSDAEAELGRRLGLQQEQLDRALMPFEMGFTLMENMQAREFAGYSFVEEQELNRLISNQNAGVKLSIAERQRLTELAIKEMEFRNNLDVAREEGSQERLTKKAPQDLGSLFGSIFG